MMKQTVLAKQISTKKRQLAYGNQEIVAIKKMKLSLSRLRSQYLELNIDSLRSHKNVSFYIEKNCRAAINYFSMYRKVPRPYNPPPPSKF